MTKKSDELQALYTAAFAGVPLRPGEPDNEGHSVAAYTDALDAGQSPQIKQRTYPVLDGFVIKL